MVMMVRPIESFERAAIDKMNDFISTLRTYREVVDHKITVEERTDEHNV